MATYVIHTRATRGQVSNAIHDLVSGLSGPLRVTVQRGILMRVGLTLLALIKVAFIIKARGGTDECGLKWAPLAESTIEARRRKAKWVRGRSTSGSPRIKTVEILRDTGRLLNSLSPGESGTWAGGQVLQMLPGLVVVGTNVKYAQYHHAGGKHLPQRRLWAPPSQWPSSWRRQIGNAAATGFVDAVRFVLPRAA